MTDADLLCGARRGDAEAWRTLYQRYLPAVWRQAYAMVPDIHAAEDITAETMVALLRNIDRLETDVPKIAGWLRAVVRCKAADHQRKMIRARNNLTAAADASQRGAADASPSAPLETEETRQHVLRALDELPEAWRIVLEWKYVDGLRVREIADRIGETEKAVESTLYRARGAFRRLFELQQLGASRPSGISREQGAGSGEPESGSAHAVRRSPLES